MLLNLNLCCYFKEALHATNMSKYCNIRLVVNLLASNRIYLSAPYRRERDTVATHSPPTSEVGGSNPRPYAEKLVVAY